MGQNSENAQSLNILRFVLAVALFVQCVPAAQAADGLANSAIESLMRSGLAHRDAGAFADAEADFRKIVEARPDHADARLLLALVIGYQERFNEALAVLEPAIAADPSRDDLILTRARLNGWAGNLALADADVQAVLARNPGDPAARELAEWLARADNQKAGRYIVSLSRSRSDFQRRSMAEWHETRIGLAYLSGAEWSVDGAFQDSRRYGNTDFLVELGGAYAVNDRVTLSLRTEASPGADFLPRWSLGGGVDLKVWSGLQDYRLGPGVATLNARHREYNTLGVTSLDPGWVQYFGDGSAWLTARRIHSWSDDAGGVQTGWSVRGDMSLDTLAPLSVYVLRAKAPETALGVTVDTWTWAGGVVLHATDAFDLRLDYTRDDRSGSYIRNVWSLGAAMKF